MKKVLAGLLVCLGSVSALAAAGSREGQGMYIQCSDPSLFQRFATYDDASVGCPKYENIFVTYDWGYRAYTCGCESPDNRQGGGGNN